MGLVVRTTFRSDGVGGGAGAQERRGFASPRLRCPVGKLAQGVGRPQPGGTPALAPAYAQKAGPGANGSAPSGWDGFGSPLFCN